MPTKQINVFVQLPIHVGIQCTPNIPTNYFTFTKLRQVYTNIYNMSYKSWYNQFLYLCMSKTLYVF